MNIDTVRACAPLRGTGTLVERLLDAIQPGGSTPQELADALGITRARAQSTINAQNRLGRIVKIGAKRGEIRWLRCATWPRTASEQKALMNKQERKI
jgi:hypothetical protein